MAHMRPVTTSSLSLWPSSLRTMEIYRNLQPRPRLILSLPPGQKCTTEPWGYSFQPDHGTDPHPRSRSNSEKYTWYDLRYLGPHPAGWMPRNQRWQLFESASDWHPVLRSGCP